MVTQITAFTGVTFPSRTQDKDTFDTNAEATTAAFGSFQTQANALINQLNALAAGSAIAVPYTFSTTTTDSDPGAGVLRLSSATQNAATVIRADLLGSDASDYTNFLGLLDDSTSIIKGYLLLQKVNDSSKFLLFSVASMASPSGYRNITVANVASSAASPFSNGDSIVMKFTPNGDKGEDGAASGLILLSTVNAANSATVDVETTFDSTYDAYLLVGSGLRPQNDSVNLSAQMKIGGSYISTSTYITQATANATSSTLASSIPLITTVWGNDAASSADLIMLIFNPSNTNLSKQLIYEITSIRLDTGATQLSTRSGSAVNSGTGALTGIRFAASSGNINSGSFRLYGFRNS